MLQHPGERSVCVTLSDINHVNLTAPAPRPMALPASAPSWSPCARTLDDLETLLLGAYGPLRGFLGPDDIASIAARGRLVDGSPWPVPVALTVPWAIAERAAEVGVLALLDEEGAGVGAVRVDRVWAVDDRSSGVAGPVEPMVGTARGTHHQLRRSATGAAPHGSLMVVPVDQPLHAPHLAQLRAAAHAVGGRITLLPLTGEGRGRSGLDGPALVRSCLAVAAAIGADVVPVPVPRHAEPDRDRILLALVARAYGATHVPGPVGERHGALPLAAELPEVVRSRRTGCWDVLEAVPIEDRLDYLADEVGGEVDRRIRHGEPVPAWMSDPAVVRELRRSRRDGRGCTVLMTGLSGSGKSTIARALHGALLERTDRTVTLLDGDVVRRMLSSELTFSRADRELNVRRIGWVAAEVTRHGGIALCAPIAPYAAMRAEVREMVSAHGTFLLVHVATAIEVCESRDRKGLYAKARAGELAAFTGISDPYEGPDDADLVIDTVSVTVDEAVGLVLAALVERGCVELEPGGC